MHRGYAPRPSTPTEFLPTPEHEASMRLKIIRDDDSITHVALIGRLDVDGATEIQYEFLLQTSGAAKRILVDLSGVSYLASFGISMLVSAAKDLERRGGRMVLLSPTPLVLKALEISNLHDVIPIATAEMAGLELLR
jgi:anti-sigma B factor antagonist